MSVQSMDKVSFGLLKNESSDNPFGTIVGKNAFFRAISSLEDIEFDEDVDFEKCITGCNDIGNNNGLTVIVSDFLTETNWKKAVDFLCYKKQQVLLIQTLTPEEIDPSYDGRVNLIDRESVDVADGRNMKIRITRSMQKAYEEALNDFKADIKLFCSKRGVDFISVSTDTPIERVLFGELLKSRYY